MWRYRYTESYELYHHGKKGQKWGVRNGPPYPLDKQKYFTKSSSYVRLGSKVISKSVRSRKTVRLSAKEYAHVMSEIATNITNEQKESPTFIKYIGDYVYMIENNYDNTYRVIGKRKIK